jgi:hypothetical protein
LVIIYEGTRSTTKHTATVPMFKSNMYPKCKYTGASFT